MTQTCTKCHGLKPLSEFHIRRDRGTHYTHCKACWKEKGRRFLANNPNKNSEYYRANKVKDPERVRKWQRDGKRRQRLDPQRRFAMSFSTHIWIALNGQRKHKPSFDFLGYTRAELMAHMERQFQRGMSWENYGEWHIDHIRPISSFVISSSRDPAMKEAWALSNLRPLWAFDNMSKKDTRTHLI